MKRQIHKKKKRKKRSISSNDLLLDMNSNVIKEAITDDTNEYKRLMKKGFTKPLYKYKHPKRTVYIHEVEKVAWFELDRRFGSLFSPLYKLRESFEKQFLGQRYWRALKYDFFKARHYVSEGVEDLFLDDDDDENKEDKEEEDSGN